MEYHSDRFEDYSLMVFDARQLVALIPGCKIEDILYSHLGLSYGGLIFKKSLKFDQTSEVFMEVLKFLSAQKIKNFCIKQIPHIYTSLPSQELDYMMFLLHAEVNATEVLSVIDNSHETFSISKIRERGVKKAKQHQVILKEESECTDFWNKVLIPNMKRKYFKRPVHSLAEITLLKSYFPKKIRQFNAYRGREIIAGVTIFETEKTAHAQYIASTDLGRQIGGLDLLFWELLKNEFRTKSYFDFGNSNENEGLNLNKGLLYWKESFGARTIVQRKYSVATKNYHKLKAIFL